MTPFDPDALVAMLITFYPAVSAAAFALARAQRPDYFSGGVIFGSKGDKLRLPDGREFDCIIAAGGPASGRRWSCSLIDPTAGGGDDPFALVDGPLAAVDEDMEIFPSEEESLVPFVAAQLSALDGADGVLDEGAQGVITFDAGAQLDNSYRALVEPAREQHEAIRAALEGDSPDSIVDATNNADPEIDSAREDYTEPEQPPTPEPDPGEPPKDNGGDGGGGQDN